MTTPNLGITHMTAAQAQKETTYNTNLDRMDVALAGTLTKNLAADADYTLSTAATPDENFSGGVTITDTGVLLTTGRSIICSTKKRRFYFVNATAQTLTVKVSGQPGVAVTAGQAGWLYCNGTDVVKMTSSW